MTNGAVRVDPLALIRSFRATYTDLRRQSFEQPQPFPDRPGPRPPGPGRRPTLADPTDQPIDEADMPEAAQTALAGYRAAHPDVRIEWERHMQADELGPTLIVEDDRDLPGEQELISVGLTTTLTTSDTASVVTDIFVGKLHRR